MKIFNIISAALFAILSVFANFANAQDVKPVKYVFLFIGDGMGAGEREMADEYSRATFRRPLLCDTIGRPTPTATRSANAEVTDSAAGGTALACGEKVNNGVLGISPDGRKLHSAANIAKDSGKKVGIISTVMANHATPAAFYAHQNSRSSMYDIALELVDTNFDYFGGGGIQLYDDKKSPNYRGSIYDLAKKAGYKVVVEDPAAFAALKPSDGKVLAFGSIDSALPPRFERIARKSAEPTLADYVAKAVELLDCDKGFFIMAEGGQIDWFCHGNDIGYAIGETVDFDDAVGVAYEFAQKHPNETLIIVTADHETGGLTTGYKSSDFKIDVSKVSLQKASLESINSEIKKLAKMKGKDFTFETAAEVVEKKIGLKFSGSPEDSMTLLPAEIEVLRKLFDIQFKGAKAATEKKLTDKEALDNKYEIYKTGKKAFMTGIGQCFARRLGAEWTTGGHTSTDIITTACGKNSELFGKKIDNTDIGKIIKASVK